MKELELVLQSVNALGDTGRWMFLAYLGKEVLQSLIAAGTFGVALYVIYKAIMRWFVCATFAGKCATHMNLTDLWSPRERAQAEIIFKKGLEK